MLREANRKTQKWSPFVKIVEKQGLYPYSLNITCSTFIVDCEKIVVQFVKDVHEKFPKDFKNLMNTLPAEQASKLNICLGAVNGTS